MLIVATVPAVIVFVVIVKVAVLAPAATVTDAGTVAAFVLLLVEWYVYNRKTAV